jgi:hypothetical protein
VPPIFEEALYCFVYWCLQNTLGNQSNLCFKFIFFNEIFIFEKIVLQYLLLHGLLEALLFILQFFGLKVVVL